MTRRALASASAGPGSGRLGTSRVASGRPIARLLVHLVVNGSLALVISGIGHALAHPVRHESHQVEDAVLSLVDRRAAPTSMPDDFEDLLGYRPAAESGTLTRPDGACSTPFGLGPPSFEPACRAHDLGYDLLRYAEATDGTLGAWARFELDRQLYRDLVGSCHDVRCRATAAAYFVSLTGNSVRQGFRAPEDEPGLPWIALGIALVAVSIATARREPLARSLRLRSIMGGVVTLARPGAETVGSQRPAQRRTGRRGRAHVSTAPRW